MKVANVSQEVTALREGNEFFLISERTKADFACALHSHAEFELNLLVGAEGALRKVGDSVEHIAALDLCLIGPNLSHQRECGQCTNVARAREISIHFLPSLIGADLLSKETFLPIKSMLSDASRGLAFAQPTISKALPLIYELSNSRGFDSYLIIMRLLYDLAISPMTRALAGETFRSGNLSHTDERIARLYTFLKQNYQRRITLGEAASFINTSEVTLSRIIKLCTGKSYVNFLNDIRLSFAKRFLIDTDRSITEICYMTGFNNISNFNRLFKAKRGYSPRDFREVYKKSNAMI